MENPFGLIATIYLNVKGNIFISQLRPWVHSDLLSLSIYINEFFLSAFFLTHLDMQIYYVFGELDYNIKAINRQTKRGCDVNYTSQHTNLYE